MEAADQIPAGGRAQASGSLGVGLGRGTGCPEEMGGWEGRSGPQAVEVRGPPCVCGGDECAHSRGWADTCGLFMGRAEGPGVLPAEATVALPPSLGAQREAPAEDRPPSPCVVLGAWPGERKSVFRKTPVALASGENVWTPGQSAPLGTAPHSSAFSSPLGACSPDALGSSLNT